MPKSTAARPPSGRTNMLPGCMSAWKNPWWKTWTKKARADFSSKSLVLCPAARKAVISSTGIPCTRSLVSTRCPVSCQLIVGTLNPSTSFMFSLSSAAAAASKRKSISNLMDSARLRIVSTRRKRRYSGLADSTNLAIHKNRSISRWKAISIFGLRTLTATSRPSRVTAKWTWAIEAAATGISSKLVNNSSICFENSASIVARACAAGNGAKLSCNWERSVENSSPNKSERVDRAWPSLMKLGPVSCRAAASRWPGRPLPLRENSRANITAGPPTSRCSNSIKASWRARIRAILNKRPIFLMVWPILRPQIRQAEWMVAIPPLRFW